MQPTMKLRFVEREVKFKLSNGVEVPGRKVRVLQQWWAGTLCDRHTGIPKGEWLDVPLEVEK